MYCVIVTLKKYQQCEAVELDSAIELSWLMTNSRHWSRCLAVQHVQRWNVEQAKAENFRLSYFERMEKIIM